MKFLVMHVYRSNLHGLLFFRFASNSVLVETEFLTYKRHKSICAPSEEIDSPLPWRSAMKESMPI